MFVISFINVTTDDIVIFGRIGLRRYTGVTKHQAQRLYRAEYKDFSFYRE